MNTVPYLPVLDPEAYSEYWQTSEMKRFTKIVNGYSDQEWEFQTFMMEFFAKTVNSF